MFATIGTEIEQKIFIGSKCTSNICNLGNKKKLKRIYRMIVKYKNNLSSLMILSLRAGPWGCKELNRAGPPKVMGLEKKILLNIPQLKKEK